MEAERGALHSCWIQDLLSEEKVFLSDAPVLSSGFWSLPDYYASLTTRRLPEAASGVALDARLNGSNGLSNGKLVINQAGTIAEIDVSEEAAWTITREVIDKSTVTTSYPWDF